MLRKLLNLSVPQFSSSVKRELNEVMYVKQVE